jgi:hypothetical protein
MNRFLHSHARPARVLVLSLCAVWALESSTFANLNPGDVQYNPTPSVSAFFTPSYTSGGVPAAYSIPVDSFSFPYHYQAGNSNETYFGSVTSSVFKNGSGQLAFSYVFNNLIPPVPMNPPATEITHATINDPSNPWTGVSILSAGADASGMSTAVVGPFGSWTNGNPFNIQRDGTNNGVGIFFNSGGSGTELASPSNDRSAVIWFTTDATHYKTSNVGLIDGGTVGSGNAFAPVVPEPSSLVLSAIGCLGVALVAWRVRQTKMVG